MIEKRKRRRAGRWPHPRRSPTIKETTSKASGDQEETAGSSHNATQHKQYHQERNRKYTAQTSGATTCSHTHRCMKLHNNMQGPQQVAQTKHRKQPARRTHEQHPSTHRRTTHTPRPANKGIRSTKRKQPAPRTREHTRAHTKHEYARAAAGDGGDGWHVLRRSKAR
jgi:hypothetical protein